MPIYEYRSKSKDSNCDFCRGGFEVLQKSGDKPLEKCPKCGAQVVRVFSGFSLGFSKTDLDRKAKEKGFHKLKKVDRGKYEKLY